MPENREKRPWIITMCHRPMYCSSLVDSEHCVLLNSNRVQIFISRYLLAPMLHVICQQLYARMLYTLGWIGWAYCGMQCNKPHDNILCNTVVQTSKYNVLVGDVK